MWWHPGDPFRALDTREVRQCRIVPGAGGAISSVVGAKISFLLERGSPGAGVIEAHCDLGTFAQNFAPDKSKETARRAGARNAGIYPQAFPNDFVRTGRG
jgi:hypothetical protein